MNSYKYFFIYDRNNIIIYGECIVWKCGEFDLTNESDITIALKKRFTARFFTSNKRIDSIKKEQKKIDMVEDTFFNYKEDYSDFITQRSDEMIYSPLIDRCSTIKMFAGCEIISNKYHNWTNEHNNLLQDIKTKFDLDLLSHPELINSFTFYEPTRIVVKSKFIDKSASGKGQEPTKIKVTFYDEFDIYTQADYIVIGYFEDRESQTIQGKISDDELVVDFYASPDELEIKIIDQGIVVYNSKHGFIRSIKINSRILGNTVALENGSIVSKYNDSNMTIGKE